MRLLEITNDFPPEIGGIENYIFSLIQRWPSSKAVVLTRSMEGDESFDRQLPFRVVRHQARVLLPSRRLLETASEILEKEKFHIVHFSGPFPLPLMGPKLKERFGVPFAVSVHGGEFVLFSTLPGVRSALKRSMDKAAVVICESSFVRGRAEGFLGLSPPTEYIPAGVDADRFSPAAEPAFRPPSHGPVIVSVSRLIARKGPATLLRSMPLVLERHPQAHALIVGGGPDETRLRRLSKRFGISGSVTFTGPRPWNEIPHYMSSGRIFALPTRPRFGGLETEGLPLAYLEAAACGLPVVAGDAGGVRDAVVHGQTGYLIDGGDPRSVAEAVIELLDDPEKARLMGERGRRRVLDEFTWRAVAQRFTDTLETHSRAE